MTDEENQNPQPTETPTPPADTQAPPTDSTNSPQSEPVSAPEETPAESTPHQEPTPAPEPAQPETPAQAEVSEPAPEPEEHHHPVPPLAGHPSSTEEGRLRGDIVKARAKIQETKRKKLDKIMAKLDEKVKITNDEVEKLLHVSDATATRYLETLEKENKIKQTGKTGKAVFYEKV